MDGRSRVGGLSLGLTLALLLGCGVSASPPPATSGGASSTPGGASSTPGGASSTPGGASSTPGEASSTPVPASSVDLAGFSIRGFGVGVTSTTYFAVDGDGNVYLPGGTEGAALVKIAPSGTVIARWAGFEVVPGQPDTIAGVAIEPGTGDVYASDTSADRVVRLTPDLAVQGSWGSTGHDAGQFSGPGGIAFDPQGNLLVADLGNNRVQRFSSGGQLIDVWTAPGGASAPVDVTTDRLGNVYVSTVQPLVFAVSAGQVLELTPDGEPVLTLAEVEGTGLTYPDAAVDADGNIYVADGWLGLLKFSANGTSLGQWDIPGGGEAAAAVRVAPSGNVYTLACRDRDGHCVLAEFTPDVELVARWDASTPVTYPGTKVDVDGYGLYLQCVGEGSPTIVWVAGGWMAGRDDTAPYLLGRLASFSRVCVYDRAGLGQSDEGLYPELSHWSRAVADLHTLLQTADVNGPYVVAGYSYGGLLARLFAYTYEDDVAGLVLIDPSHEDAWAQPVPMPLAPFDIVTCTDASCPLYEDITQVHGITHGKVAGSLGALPLVVLSHSPTQPFWGADYDAHWQKLQAETASASSNALHVVATWSSHPIVFTQPGLVLEAVSEVIAATQASDHTLAPCGPAITELGGTCQ